MKKTSTIILLFIVLSGCSYNEEVFNTSEIDANILMNANYTNLQPKPPVKQLEGEFFLPILNFHHVGPAPANASQEARTWYVSSERFIEVLDIINEAGFESIFLSDVLKAINGELELPANPLVITFDDAHIDIYENAWPVLLEREIKFTVNVMTSVRGEHYFNDEIIKELDSSGLVEFGSHTKYHEFLTRVSIQEAREELEGSKIALEEIIEKEIYVIAYPFGLYNDEVVQVSKDLGYEIGLTIDWGSMQNTGELMEMKRYNITKYSNLDTILTIQ